MSGKTSIEKNQSLNEISLWLLAGNYPWLEKKKTETVNNCCFIKLDILTFVSGYQTIKVKKKAS